MTEIVTVGETMVLLVPVQDGPLDAVTQFTRTIGGAETNMAIGLVRLGHSVTWFSHVGDDPFGRYMLRTIGAEGVDISRVGINPHAPTGIFFRERIPDMPPVGYYYRHGSAASHLKPTDLPDDLFDGARIFHCTGISPILTTTFRDTIETAMDRARAAGLRVCFDPNLRLRLTTIAHARTTLLPLLRKTDILLTGLGEIRHLLEEDDPIILSTRLREEYGIEEIVFKDGAQGALIAGEPGSVQRVSAVSFGPEIDSTGAGDAFNAGYLSGRLRGMAPLDAARLGAIMGGHAVVHYGDYENLPTWEEVKPYLDS